MSTTRQRAAYHHGDLPTALVDATLELIAEQGTRGFTVVEVARRTGVSTSAPYRHFADREELLAATAVRSYEELSRRFEIALASAAPPADRLAAVAAAYVRFAAERRAMFEVLFGAGLDKSRYPALQQAAGEVLAAVSHVAAELVPGDDERLAWMLVQAVAAVAHGHAALLLDGGLAEHATAADALAASHVSDVDESTIVLTEQRAAAATRALLRGRSLLFESTATRP